MKAYAATRYGGPEVLELVEIDTPVPADDEVLIRIHATTVTAGDWRVRSMEIPRGFRFLSRLIFGLRKPRQPVLGSELAGTVEAVGSEVSRFAVGDAVFAYSNAKLGSHAEYACLSEGAAIAHKPARLTFEEAAALSFGGTTALHFLRRGGITWGERVLVNGASGAVGTAAVQLAKHFGAEVTGVCSTANVELVRSLGADAVIDYTREDVTSGGENYDLIVDAAGTLPFARADRILAEKGRLLQVVGTLPEMLRAPWVALTSSKRIVPGTATGKAEDLHFLADLVESGRFHPVIDRMYPFQQMVDAHRYVDTGRKRGNVVVSLLPTPLAT